MGRMARKAAATKGWPDRLFIDGQWCEGAAQARMTVVNPATGMPLGSVARAEPADVDRAVAAARRAFRGWKRLPGAQRGAFLAAIADGLEARRATLIQRQQLNSGKPFAEAEIDIGDAIATYRYYAGLAADLDARQGEGVALPEPALRGYSRFEPLGVAGLIVPWNFPMVTSAWKAAPALAAGCTVVLKPSEYTPFNELALAEVAAEAGLPAGVLNIVTGATECGAALTHHPGIAKLSFTGSNAVGSRIMQAAAARCLPISLELGGKSPILVFEDVDPDEAAETVAAGIFFNAGQVCSATSRLLVARPVADALRDRLRSIAETLPVGDPLDPATRMGPLTTNAQYGKVQAYFAAAKAQGLKPLAGGAVRPGDGHFVEPTIYWDVPVASSLWQEEVFGPVLCARTFDTEEEAIALANDSAFGLAATILSRDAERADRVAAELEAGHVWVNTPQVVFPQGAWGGFKASGIGRELGPWGLSAYLGVKHVTAARP